MRIRIEAMEENPVTLLRRAGYVFQRKEGSEMSFVRVLGRSGFPRFHIYATLKERTLMINFHLDQKQHTYGQETRHHGEYENDGALKDEAAHLLKVLGPRSTLV